MPGFGGGTSSKGPVSANNPKNAHHEMLDKVDDALAEKTRIGKVARGLSNGAKRVEKAMKTGKAMIQLAAKQGADEIAKTYNSKKKQKKEPNSKKGTNANHPEWYANNVSSAIELTNTAFNFAYNASRPVLQNEQGEALTIPTHNYEGNEGTGAITPVNRIATPSSIPLVLRIDEFLSTYSPEDIDASVKEYMIKVRKQLTTKSGRNPNYPSKTVMYYMHDVRALWADLAHLVKTYVHAFVYSSCNTSVGKALITGDGFEPAQFETLEFGKIRDTLVKMVAAASIFPCPCYLIDRTIWLFLNTFSDYDGPRATYIVHVPNNTTWFSPEDNDSFSVMDTWGYKNGGFSTTMEEAINTWYERYELVKRFSEETTLVSDMERAFGWNNTNNASSALRALLTANEPQFKPICDKYHNLQMQNIKCGHPAILSALFSEDTVAPDVRNGGLAPVFFMRYKVESDTGAENILQLQRMLKTATALTTASATILNGDPSYSAEMNCSITRLAPVYGPIESSGVTGSDDYIDAIRRVKSCGTEVPIGMRIITGFQIGNSIEIRQSYVSDITVYRNNTSQLRQVHANTSLLSQIDNHPFAMSLMVSTVGYADDGTYPEIYSEFDDWTYVSGYNLRSIHNKAVSSLFYLKPSEVYYGDNYT